MLRINAATSLDNQIGLRSSVGGLPRTVRQAGQGAGVSSIRAAFRVGAHAGPESVKEAN